MSDLQGSGKPVQDFTSYCEGDTEPKLNKKIQVLIDRMSDYIVYLDQDFYVEWVFVQVGRSSPAFDTVANRIGELETLSVTQLSTTQRGLFGRLLGEAMARTIGGGDEDKAKEVLDRAQAYLTARGTENARRWYLEGAATAFAIAAAMAALLLVARNHASGSPWMDAIEAAAGAGIGSLGAVLSIAARAESINLAPVAGPGIHRFEGMIRVAAGVAGALFVALAIKANLLLDGFQRISRPFLGLIVMCIIAGASERLVPGLIKKMGKSVQGQ